MNVQERFLHYVSFDTQSDASSLTAPSTEKQWVLAKELVKECQDMGFDEVCLSEYGIVYAALEANDPNCPSLGFCAHMDTASELSGANIHPWILSHYDGQDITYPDGSLCSVQEYPSFLRCIGEDLILTDGTTLLGGDDKAGIAIILTAVEEVIRSNQRHGKIVVAFTPDEEIGRGVDHFDLDRFAVDYAYTVDGGRVDAVNYENFNAAMAQITIRGTSIHPGDAKDKMVNASLLASEWIQKMPKKQTPAHTENRQGFYHLLEMNGTCEKATLTYLLRHHDQKKFLAQKDFMHALCEKMNQQYPGRFTIHIQDQYLNMKDLMKDKKAVRRAKKAIKANGLEPVSIPTRGGTDGAMLTEKGCTCPNLGTGSYNHHGRFEFCSIQQMEKMVNIVQFLIELS